MLFNFSILFFYAGLLKVRTCQSDHGTKHSLHFWLYTKHRIICWMKVLVRHQDYLKSNSQMLFGTMQENNFPGGSGNHFSILFLLKNADRRREEVYVLGGVWFLLYRKKKKKKYIILFISLTLKLDFCCPKVLSTATKYHLQGK